MKSILTITLVAILGIFITSCKKDVKPTLIVTAVDTQGEPMHNVSIITHPCYDLSCDVSKLNPDYHQQQLSNAAGEAIFVYPNSALLDVVAIAAVTDQYGGTLALRIGYNVVSFDLKKLNKGEKNEYQTTVVIEDYLP